MYRHSVKCMKCKFLFIALFFLCVGCGKSAENQTNIFTQIASAPIAVSTIPKDGNYPGRGTVTKINTELVSVELDHEEIVGLMPKMIMEFYVRDASLLDGLKVGDNVEFVLEYKHPSETIVGIKKIQ